MPKRVPHTSDEVLNAMIIRRRVMEDERNPRIRLTDSCLIKDGPRVKKIAMHGEIIDEHTGELHHHLLKIETFKRLGDDWNVTDERSITLGDGGIDELYKLSLFASGVLEDELPANDGDYMILGDSEGGVGARSLGNVLETLGRSLGWGILTSCLSRLAQRPDALKLFGEMVRSDPIGSRLAAVAINLTIYDSVIAELEALIEANVLDGRY